MEQRHTLWKTGRTVLAALTVDYSGETTRAVQFTLTDNPRCSIWLPKKAVKFEADNQVTIANWFPLGEFARSVFDRYANHYSR